MVPQLSAATAPPRLERNALQSAALPAPSQVGLALDAGTVIVGGVVSVIENTLVVTEVRPQPSKTVKETVTEPVQLPPTTPPL